MARRRWSDELAPDVLREIAGRLHVAADFVRFHAVCKPWRDSRDPLSGTRTTNQFLPWLLASAGKQYHHLPLKLRCVFSKSSYRASSAPPRRSWVASADGDTLRYLTVDVIRPRLHDPLTGAVTELPIFPPTHNLNNESWGENSYGTIYRDGTTLLIYTVFVVHGGRTRFRAALLRPGETNKWTYVDRIIPTRQGEFCVAYHGGRIFATVEGSLWRVVAADGGCDDVLFRSPWMPGEHDTDDSEQYNYVLESHGELLWVSVRLRYTYQYPIGSHHAHTLSVSVHALQESPSSSPKKMRWIRKDGRSLADRVLFLGSPNSFTMDAASLPGCRHGGCAYFVYHNIRASSRPFELFGVFRYDLVEGKSEFIERLPPEWDNEKCTWLIPQPIIAPLQEINERKMDAPKLKNLEQHKTVTVTSPTHVINIERHYEPSFKVLVRNLPHSIDKFQLECFFNKHGKVSNSEIIYDKNTKTSDGKGIVTMTTMHVHQEDAIAALQGLVLDGCRLDVILVNDRPRPRR